jgi:hypothetical protein
MTLIQPDEILRRQVSILLPLQRINEVDVFELRRAVELEAVDAAGVWRLRRFAVLDDEKAEVS